MFFFFKQKTAYERRISDWSSDVCSSDLHNPCADSTSTFPNCEAQALVHRDRSDQLYAERDVIAWHDHLGRSEEHTSELQSLMRISYAVFCLKKKKTIDISVTLVELQTFIY